MAGKGQHYIPRFLLNGFASRTQGEESFVWCFRQGGSPFETNTVNVGKERLFYGEPDGPLDKFITDELEMKQSDCLVRVRKDRTITSPADEETLIDFVHSLVLRPRNLRDRVEKGSNAVLEEAQQIFTDVTAARQWMLNEGKKGSPVWDNLLTQYVRAKYGVQTNQREKYLKWKKKEEFKRYLLHNSGAEEILQQLTASVKAQLPQVLGQVGEMIKTSHNNALEKGLQTDVDEFSPRYARYLQMHWRLQSLEDKSLILGDVAVLQFEKKTEEFSAAYDGIGGDIIFLPLSHNLLIIGTTTNKGTFPSSDEINRHSAALSINYFVAAQNSERERDYQTILGHEALQFSKVF